MKLKCEIFCDCEISRLEDQISDFLRDFDPKDIKQILQSESNGSITITIFYLD